MAETLGPAYDSSNLFFVGNGVLRVPSRLASRDGPGSGEPLPSWNDYMERLWQLVERARGADRSGDLAIGHFLELSAPRQAEWFDRQIRAHPELRPLIFETGATGIELTDSSIKGQPSIWTAGIGSFARTLVCLADWPAKAGGRPLLTYLDSYREIEKVLRRSSDLDQRYLVRLCGFGTEAWQGGFSHEDETAFGRELLRSWHDLAPTVASLLGLANPKNGTWLKLEDWRVGRGVLVTAHEAGLMALWERDGSLQSVSVEIEASGNGKVLGFHTVSAGAAGRRVLPRVEIQVLEETIELAIEGGSGRILPLPSDRRRRNTLGAGDTVRGALAFGLWRLADTAAESADPEAELAQIVRASAVLASVKCYVGSFIDFLRRVTELRGDTDAWRMFWPGRVLGEEARVDGGRT
jgi:hypothetical protein